MARWGGQLAWKEGRREPAGQQQEKRQQEKRQQQQQQVVVVEEEEAAAQSMDAIRPCFPLAAAVHSRGGTAAPRRPQARIYRLPRTAPIPMVMAMASAMAMAMAMGMALAMAVAVAPPSSVPSLP